MDWYVIVSFLTATLLLLMTPGPVMAIVGHNTLRHGVSAGLLTVLGIEIGEICLLGATCMGLMISSEILPELFRWMSLAGALYLVWLAAGTLRVRSMPARIRTGAGSPRPLMAGFAVALGNPTAVIFYAAFFPQFINPTRPISEQVLLLGAMDLLTALVFDLMSVLTFASICRLTGLRRLAGFAELASAAVYVAIAVITAVSFVKSFLRES